MSIYDRFEEFLSRLLAHPGCASFKEAFGLLGKTLDQVEDELSGIPYDPAFPHNDGRMYPPQEDAYRSVPGREDLRRYRSRQHNSYFSEGGAILIVALQAIIVLDKPDLEMRSIKL